MKRYARTVGLALALALGAASAHAQDADPAVEARQQYQLGGKAFKERRYSEAALHFEAAASFRVSAVALYTAGLAWDLGSKPERAADAFARALEVPGLDAKQRANATERIAALEKTLGTLAVTAPEGWKVQLDTYTEVPAPARLHGPPGVRALSVRAPGKPIERRDVALEVDTVQTLELNDEPKRAAQPDEPRLEPTPEPKSVAVREAFWTIRRVAGVGVAGLGVAALGGTVVLGLSANGAKDAYDAAPTRAAYDHASSLQTWTNVSLIAGGLLVAGGAVLVFLPDKSAETRVHVGLARSGVSLSGRF